MRLPVRLCLAALAGALLVSGCALRDARDSYAYGRTSDGLWDAEPDFLLDWRFPTSQNLGPVEAPQRFKPERPAIGVPWATGNPVAPPTVGQAPALESAVDDASEPSAHQGDATPHTSAMPEPRTADGVGGVRDARVDERLIRR
jgi:hypothetical protein